LIHKFGSGFIGLLGIFLPGTLLIFFVAPIWESLKKRALIQKSMKGINAAACGLIVASVPILFMKLPHDGSWNSIIIAGIAAITFVLAKWKLVPVPLIIGACLIAGLVIPPVY
jgi:chromate transporter